MDRHWSCIMIQIVGLSGSLRRGSFNSSLLRAAAAIELQDCKIMTETIAGIPLYNGDDEVAKGIPEAATRLKNVIAQSDGLLIATPEYNNSIPGVVKNAIDWLSRPPNDIPRVFRGKMVALMGASPGGFGTVLSQNAWLPVLRTLGTDLWTGGRLTVARAGSVFDASGEIIDQTVRENLQRFVQGFAEYVRVRSSQR
jgi:chromate reductase